MALIDIKKLRPHWKGEFAANVAYLVNDVVIYSVPFTNQRIIYICKTNSIGNLPSDTNFFDIMVQNIVPLDQTGEIYYYSTSVSPAQNVALSPPNGVARIEMTGSVHNKTQDARDYHLMSEGEGTNPYWDIPKVNSRHTVRKLCNPKYGDIGTPTFVIMDNGEVWTIGGYGHHAGMGEYWGHNHAAPQKLMMSPNCPGALDIISNNSFAFMIDKERKLWAWGYSDSYNTARETSSDYLVSRPLRVGTGTTSSDFKTKYVTKFDCGGAMGDDQQYNRRSTNVALMTDGSIYTWGDNSHGAVGNGTTATYQNTPWQISGTWTNVWSFGLERQARIYATRLEGGVEKLYAWGANRYGALGVGDTNSRQTPTLVAGDGLLEGEEVGMIWAADAGASPDFNTTFFQTKKSRRLYVTGDDEYGATGQGTNRGTSTPYRESPELCAWGGNTSDNPYVVDLQLKKHRYANHAALMSDGTLRTWGRYEGGALGDNGSSERYAPFNPIEASSHLYDSPIVKIQVNGAYYSSWTPTHQYNTYVLRADGTIWSCGANNQRQLGQGDNVYGNSHSWGYVSHYSGDPEYNRGAEFYPGQRYWSVEREGGAPIFNTTSYTKDQVGVKPSGTLKPIYGGFHRYTDFCANMMRENYGENNPFYIGIYAVDENGTLNVWGDNSYNRSGRQYLTNGGLVVSCHPVPLNFP